MSLADAIRSRRPDLVPSPTLDAAATGFLAKVRAAGEPPAPGPAGPALLKLIGQQGLDVERVSQVVQSGKAANGPNLNGPRIRRVIEDRDWTHFGTAEVVGPKGNALWVFVLARPRTASVPVPPLQPTPPQPSGIVPDPIQADLLARHTAERARASLPALRLESRLTAAAMAHAADMARTGRLDHTGSDGSDIGARATRAGYRWFSQGGTVGENIAGAGPVSPQVAMELWLRSVKHRGQILGPQFADMGIGHAADATGQDWYCTVFGREGRLRPLVRGHPCPAPRSSCTRRADTLACGAASFLSPSRLLGELDEHPQRSAYRPSSASSRTTSRQAASSGPPPSWPIEPSDWIPPAPEARPIGSESSSPAVMPMAQRTPPGGPGERAGGVRRWNADGAGEGSHPTA